MGDSLCHRYFHTPRGGAVRIRRIGTPSVGTLSMVGTGIIIFDDLVNYKIENGTPFGGTILQPYFGNYQ